ncbi:MAG: phosphate acyltransferase PlsX [Clostridiales bacterium]|nr:phosphate acyltransferase PlsX [Clostridiales bacterium]
MRIALDIMGGDKAPKEIIEGGNAIALKEPSWEIVMVGTPETRPLLDGAPANVKFIPCGCAMGMDEPVEALLHKKDSSIWVATKLVKDGEAGAVVSAGSTGAQMSAAILLLGRVKGIARPAITVVLPTLQGGKVMLDMGANPDVKPEMLLQFAQMGAIYAGIVRGVANPRVVLLSNGTEENKGNEITVAAHKLLAASGLNFAGNLEGRDIPKGDYDVLVCDGFSGNIVLKTMEGLNSALFSLLKEEFSRNLLTKTGAALVWKGLKNIKLRLDYAEHGGAPLLGVNGVSIICHGSSPARAIENAVKVAVSCVRGDFVGKTADFFNNKNARE